MTAFEPSAQSAVRLIGLLCSAVRSSRSEPLQAFVICCAFVRTSE
jgi:hypothetical protein